MYSEHSQYDIKIQQNQDWVLEMQWLDGDDSPIDLSNYSAFMQIREYTTSETIAVELSTENEKITLDDSGNISLSLNHNDTKNLKFTEYVYDIILISDMNSRFKILEGNVIVNRGVTRDYE